jgi:hypothetical protein
MDFALIELLFSFGVILALAVWELLRTPRPDRDEPVRPGDDQEPPQT